LYGVISVLDGIAVEIRCPTAADCSNPTSYYNRKGFYAICVQAAVLAYYKVCLLSTKHAGSTHDSTAFGSTSMHAYLLKAEQEGGCKMRRGREKCGRGVGRLAVATSSSQT
jgi:hypothetical protein